jgi:Putative peptidoglycan binding domain
MSQNYEAKPGECISSISFDHGFFPGTIWNLEENRVLRELRGNPQVLAPGDKVFIPDKRPRNESCATDQLHCFKRKGVPEQFRIQLLYDDQPRKNEAFVLEIEGKVVKSGKTGVDGVIQIPIVPNARRGRLLLRGGSEEIALELGRLEPVEMLEGVQMRLRNLGYFAGEVDGQMSDDLEYALVCFQSDNDLEPTGDVDDKTRALLKSRYGG